MQFCSLHDQIVTICYQQIVLTDCSVCAVAQTHSTTAWGCAQLFSNDCKTAA